MSKDQVEQEGWRMLDSVEDAERLCHSLNHSRTNLTVMVDGPEDGQVTLMSIRDAIAFHFLYRWVA